METNINKKDWQKVIQIITDITTIIDTLNNDYNRHDLKNRLNAIWGPIQLYIKYNKKDQTLLNKLDNKIKAFADALIGSVKPYIMQKLCELKNILVNFDFNSEALNQICNYSKTITFKIPEQKIFNIYDILNNFPIEFPDYKNLEQNITPHPFLILKCNNVYHILSKINIENEGGWHKLLLEEFKQANPNIPYDIVGGGEAILFKNQIHILPKTSFHTEIYSYYTNKENRKKLFTFLQKTKEIIILHSFPTGKGNINLTKLLIQKIKTIITPHTFMEGEFPYSKAAHL